MTTQLNEIRKEGTPSRPQGKSKSLETRVSKAYLRKGDYPGMARWSKGGSGGS